MMVLERYIVKKIFLATLTVLAAAAGLVFVISLLGELRQVGEGDYSMLRAAVYALLELPFNVSQFFPMIVLLGGLAGFGILATGQELVVMRASGFSPRGFIKATVLTALLLSAVGLLTAEGLAPRLHYIANMHKTADLSGGQAVVTRSGLWLHQRDNFIHIRQVMAHHHLVGITRYEFDGEHRLMAAGYADSMDYQNGQWTVHRLARTFFPTSGGTQNVFYDSAVWDMQISPVILSAGVLEPEEMPLDRLQLYTRHLIRNGMQAAEFQFSFSRRVLLPLSVFVMVFLALPFAFIPPRTVSPGLRLFMGVLAGFVFYMLSTLAGQFSVIFQLSPWFSALFPAAVVALLDGWLIHRTFR